MPLLTIKSVIAHKEAMECRIGTQHNAKPQLLSFAVSKIYSMPGTWPRRVGEILSSHVPDMQMPGRLAGGVQGCLGVHQKGDNETVQTWTLIRSSFCQYDWGVPTQHFGENENQNHANEETRLLGSSTDTSITDNANGKASGETGKTDRETGTKLDEAGVECHILREVVRDEDGHDQAVDTNDTGHNDGDNVCGRQRGLCDAILDWDRTLHDEIRSEDTHGSNADARLGGTVGGTETSEDDGAGAAHSTEEGLVVTLAHARVRGYGHVEMIIG